MGTVNFIDHKKE